MKIENRCHKCKKKKATNLKLIAYYSGIKPIYHKFCDKCMKADYEEVKKELDIR